MNLIRNTTKKNAIIISYITLLLNTLSTVFLTRILLHFAGPDEYGLYQMIYSLASNVLILDMGISTVLMRYISEYRIHRDTVGEQNFSAMMAIISLVACVIISVICCAFYFSIDKVYPSLSVADIQKSKTMLIMMCGQFVFTICSNYFTGLIQGYERFSYCSIRSAIGVIIAFVANLYFVMTGYGAIGMVLANLLLAVFQAVSDGVFALIFLKIKIAFYSWDSIIIRPAVGLMLAMMLQSIIGHVNSTADKTILGILCTKNDVVVYSLAATVLTMFNTLPSIISGYFQPTVMRIINGDHIIKELENLVVYVGRWQYMICAFVLGGFVLAGQDFITLWAGQEYSKSAWIITLIIMPVNMIPLVENVCLSILNAYNKRIYRSIILVGMSIFNIVLSIVLIKRIGPIGAPIGTAIAYLLGNIILQNIYYHNALGLNIMDIFRRILNKQWIVMPIALLLCIPLFLLKYSLANLALKVFAYTVIYLLVLYLIGMTTMEKEQIICVAKRGVANHKSVK